MDDKFVRNARGLLAEGVLEVDDVGGIAGVVLVGFEAGEVGDDAFGIDVVDDGTVLGYFLLVEEVVGAETVDVADKEVGRDGVVGVEADAFAHGAAGAVGEGEAEHVAVVGAPGMGLDDTLGKDEGFAAARRGKHKMPTAVDVDDGLLVRIGCGGHDNGRGE